MQLIDLSIRTPHKYKVKFKEGGAIWTITSLYLKCLGKYNSKSIRKAIIEIINEDSSDKLKYMGDVILISKTFNFSAYSKAIDKYSKKKLLLDVLQDGLNSIANQDGWETQPLANAYNCCLEKNLEHKWLRKDKYFLSPDRKLYAGVYCNWDIDKFEAFAVFLNKQKEEIKRIKLFETEPWDVEPMGKMGWDKETGEFNLYSKDGKTKWKASVDYQLS